MTKKILLISYSQTGQLTRLAENFLIPLQNQEGIIVEHYQLQPEKPFDFPWKFLNFFNTFPETVHLMPAPIKMPNFHYKSYDVVIIAYSAWFLSPNQPITAFLQSEQAKTLLKDKPVITLIGCRNMWLMAQEKMKNLLKDCGANLVGNVVKIDQCNDWASFITTPMWLLTGKKQRFSWLPKAGISETEIADMQRFGEKLRQVLAKNEKIDTALFQNMQAVKIDEKLMLSEKVGSRSFYIWGKLLIKCGTISASFRKIVLVFYIIFLIGLILTVVPISALIKKLLRPLMKHKLTKMKAYFAEPSGE